MVTLLEKPNFTKIHWEKIFIMSTLQITQYDCNYENLAPSGCNQYFFGSTSGMVQSFNYDGGTHLADQNQNMCIRTERGNCK